MLIHVFKIVRLMIIPDGCGSRYLAGPTATSCEGSTTTTVTTATTTTTTATATRVLGMCNGIRDPLICRGQQCHQIGVRESCPALCNRCAPITTQPTATPTTTAPTVVIVAAQTSNNGSSNGPGWPAFVVVCVLAAVLGGIAIVIKSRSGGTQAQERSNAAAAFENPICKCSL